MIQYEINPEYAYLKEELLTLPERFRNEGDVIYSGRNILKIIEVGGIRMNIKSFKEPHLINKFAYAYIRKSKAERSFEYACKFMALGIGTPEPIAYILFRDWLGITRSYYISLQVDCDFTFRGLTELQPRDMDEILKAFTRFTYDFQSKGVHFIDHSPGNTLIKREDNGTYSFYLVDLNRTEFINIPPQEGLKNFRRLYPTEYMIDVMAQEYAHLTNADEKESIRRLQDYTAEFNEWDKRKKERRKKIKSIFR